ncbi:MAG: methyl-accepting chemotaxis protein [Treponema sp.]|nr:methyl-accepting chemotaxis protein [Treponema sp.]
MRINLKIKLLILTLLIIVLTTISLGLISYKTEKDALTSSVNKTLDVISDKVAQQIYDLNESELIMLRSIAKLPFISSTEISQEEINQQLIAIPELDLSKYENVILCNKQGIGFTRDGSKTSFTDTPYFKAAISGNEFISNPYHSSNNQIYQYYAVPVTNSKKEITGALISVIKGDRLSKIVSEIEIGAGFHPGVLDRATGESIANVNEGTNDNNDNVEALDPNSGIGRVMYGVMTGGTDTFVFEDPNIHLKMTGSYRPINATTWSVFCIAPYDFFYQDLYKLRFSLIFGLSLSVIIAVLLGIILISIIIKPLTLVKKSIEEIASGSADLTKRLPISTKDEIGEVVNGFNKFTEKLQSIMKDLKISNSTLEEAGDELNASTDDTSNAIKDILNNINEMQTQISNQTDSVSQTAGAVNEIASNIESLERMIETQSNGVAQASTAVEEMIGNINSVNNSVDRLASSFESLAASAQTGVDLQVEAAERIEKIKAQSETLREANLAIAAIAGQTNLLAMNAAIEAAHAGDSGKGFSVVADEIRKLSETSGLQSKTIGNQLKNIHDSIEDMVNASIRSGEAFNIVTTQIKDTDELVHQIKAAMEEQTIGSQQINSALSVMNDNTIEVRTASKEMSAGNKAILDEVRNLQDTTTAMKDSMLEMTSGAKRIDETGIALSDISNKLKESINDIGEHIDQFNV